jgi:hypothetical protein
MAYGAALDPTTRLMPTLLAGEGNEDCEGQDKISVLTNTVDVIDWLDKHKPDRP